MNAGERIIDYPAETCPKDVLKQLIGAFSCRGLLNRSLHILHGERMYRIFCSSEEFLAYRVGGKCGAPAGERPVCIVNYDRILEDENLSGFASNEPSAYEWLQFVSNSNLEVLYRGVQP